MKAIAGRKNVIAWAGKTMAQAMVAGIDDEQEELGSVDKCSAMLDGHICARPVNHEGFHFSTMLVLTIPARVDITAVWER